MSRRKREQEEIRLAHLRARTPGTGDSDWTSTGPADAPIDPKVQAVKDFIRNNRGGLIQIKAINDTTDEELQQLGINALKANMPWLPSALCLRYRSASENEAAASTDLLKDIGLVTYLWMGSLNFDANAGRDKNTCLDWLLSEDTTQEPTERGFVSPYPFEVVRLPGFTPYRVEFAFDIFNVPENARETNGVAQLNFAKATEEGFELVRSKLTGSLAQWYRIQREPDYRDHAEEFLAQGSGIMPIGEQRARAAHASAATKPSPRNPGPSTLF